MNFRELLEKNEFVFLDGAMGTQLQKNGLKAGGLPEALSIEQPDLIIDIHKSYIEAGSQIIYTNTFGANEYKVSHSDYTVEQLIGAAVQNAKTAAKGTGTLTALDIGPIGQLLEPTGTLSFERAYELFKQQIAAGKDADLVVFETMTDLHEMKAAVLAAKENSDLPVLCTMTFEENLRTFTGCSISAMALTLEGLGADAIGLNCSLGPKEIYPIVQELARWTSLPIIVKPNAGLPNPLTGAYNVTPGEFALYMKELIPLGVKIFGGCCGTAPEYITEVKKICNGLKSVSVKKEKSTAVCSSLTTVELDIPRAAGERINPTGKKRLKEALISGNVDYILNLAIEQAEGGADIICINAGLPEIDEKEVMVKLIKEVQSVVDAPLVIDSTIPEVIEAAARVYNGRPIINSVNGEMKSMESIFPIIKKYGACVTCLALDENGIPGDAEERVKIAERIVQTAKTYGIPEENLIVDCLALTISSEQDMAVETLKTIRLVKEQLHLKTVLGVSNISFGLPRRELINANFLAMALQCGLDMPIINVNEPLMIGCIRSYQVIAGNDRGSLSYIRHYKETKSEGNQKQEAVKEKNIMFTIENGLKQETAQMTKNLLLENEPMTIVNDILIPILDKTGEEFEKGDIFLPQLIMAAGAVQSAFEVIKDTMMKDSHSFVSKGKVVLATVKGDVHDIGKNIVKILLENYGYTVIDLGKSVEYQAVVDAVKKHDVKLVGLSALMTSTLSSMKETIALIRKNNLDCKVVVGGAVLTAEYAKSIGADFYAKDAKETVDAAKKIFSC